MKSVGIREAKAHFSELVRAAANGERIVRSRTMANRSP
jgi:prevent-host-death family protein